MKLAGRESGRISWSLLKLSFFLRYHVLGFRAKTPFVVLQEALNFSSATVSLSLLICRIPLEIPNFRHVSVTVKKIFPTILKTIGAEHGSFRK